MTHSKKRVSHRRSLLKVLYQSILNAKLTKNWVAKGAQATRMTASLRILQSRFKHLGELHKEWIEAGVRASRVTTLRYLQEKGFFEPLLKQKQRQRHLTWAKEKNDLTVAQWSKVLFSDESKFEFYLEIKVWRKTVEAQKSCVKFLKSMMI